MITIFEEAAKRRAYSTQVLGHCAVTHPTCRWHEIQLQAEIKRSQEIPTDPVSNYRSIPKITRRTYGTHSPGCKILC